MIICQDLKKSFCKNCAISFLVFKKNSILLFEFIVYFTAANICYGE